MPLKAKFDSFNFGYNVAHSKLFARPDVNLYDKKILKQKIVLTHLPRQKNTVFAANNKYRVKLVTVSDYALTASATKFQTLLFKISLCRASIAPFFSIMERSSAGFLR